ncbi:hypothetical protein GW17_00054974 [Ensete ventricosum]|nr:hypothetical protein GW17_00054974 [Ensete ventricosum]RZS21545.1 hypothetical protein BHM03_00054199 [Ensete ventricosum]
MGVAPTGVPTVAALAGNSFCLQAACLWASCPQVSPLRAAASTAWPRAAAHLRQPLPQASCGQLPLAGSLYRRLATA